MPRAKIGTQGVSVELEGNEVSAEQLGEQALDLYRRACEIDAAQRVGASLGFGRKEGQGK
jgi:hypothetical protein